MDRRAALRRGLQRAGHTCWILFRVTIPTYVVMDLLARLGVIAAIGAWCEPAMALFRLPGEAAVPILIGYLVNVYTATAALGNLGLSGGQVTTLALMIGTAHSLLVEAAILRAAGARASALLLYRLLMSIVVGLLSSRLFLGAGA